MDFEIEYRQCSRCKETRALYEFWFSKKSGRHLSHCKICADKYRCNSEREKLRKNCLDVAYKFRS